MTTTTDDKQILRSGSRPYFVEQVLQLPKYGVYHLVVGAPLTVDAEAFKAPSHDAEGLLKEILARLTDQGGSL